MSPLERFMEIRLFVSGETSTENILKYYAINNDHKHQKDSGNKNTLEENIKKKLLNKIEPGRPNLDKV